MLNNTQRNSEIQPTLVSRLMHAKENSKDQFLFIFIVCLWLLCTFLRRGVTCRGKDCCLNCPIQKASDISAIEIKLFHYLFFYLNGWQKKKKRLKVKDETAYSLYLAQFANASRSQKTQGLGSTNWKDKHHLNYTLGLSLTDILKDKETVSRHEVLHETRFPPWNRQEKQTRHDEWVSASNMTK